MGTSVGVLIAACAAGLVWLAPSPAQAQEETTLVFPVVGGDKVAARHVERATRAVDRALKKVEGVAVAQENAGAAIGEDAAGCAVESSCLARAGARLGAARVVGVLLSRKKGGFEVTFVLVSVAASAEIARSVHDLGRRDLSKRVGQMLAEFLAEAPSDDAAVASKDGAGAGGAPKPWVVGVTPEKEQQALAIFNEGNSYFEQSQYAQALSRYRKAIEYWDHPAIRFNIAVCLVNLDQPVEAYDNLTKALQYGEEPLGAKLHADGITYKKLLLGRLGKLRVTCEEPGTAVTLDGKDLFVGPGDATQMLVPGAHQLVASKEGFLARTETVMLLGGKEETVALEMIALEDATVSRRRWKAWKPWAVFGGGVGVGLVGVLLYWRADVDFKSYDSEIDALCNEGCTDDQLPGPVRGLETRAKVENGAAIASFAIGGAAAVAGIALVIMNQRRAVRVTDPAELEHSEKQLTFSPLVAPGRAGVTAELRF